MPYYAYLAFNPRLENPDSKWWSPSNPLVCFDVVKGRKGGRQRLEKLLERHKNLLPQDGWKERISHYKLDTEDNRVIEALKNDIRMRMATLSITRYGERRFMAKTPGAPAGFYKLDFSEANGIVQDAIRKSGLYMPSGRAA